VKQLSAEWPGGVVPGALLLGALFLIASSPYIGDSMVYMSSVEQYRSGKWDGPFHPLWEFGHLLWRPLAALLAPLFLKIIPDSVAWTGPVKIAYGLMILNIIIGMCTGGILYNLWTRMGVSRSGAVLLTLAFGWANGYLMYTLSASAYATGMLLEVIAIWLLVTGEIERPSTGVRYGYAGLLMGLAALMWFPYILAVPAVAAIPWLGGRRTPSMGIRSFILIGLVSAVVIGIGLSIGGWLAGVRSPGQAVAWFEAARHGVQQDNRLMRAATGIPRMLVDLARDGVHLKRYVLKDPYNTVSKWEILRVVVWKMAVAYACIASIVLIAFRSSRGRPFVWLYVICFGIYLFFAIALFEPSGSERLIPSLPFLLLCLAAAWNDVGKLKWIPAACLIGMILINVPSYLSTWSAADRRIREQVADFRQVAGPNDLLVSVTFSEPLPFWIEQRVFHPAHQGISIATYQLLELMSAKIAEWHEPFARRVLLQWSRGSDVWIGKSALQPRPAPELNWAEGDASAVRWSDIHKFLSTLEFDRESPHPYGFRRIARSEANRRIFEAFAEGMKAATRAASPKHD